MMPTLVTMEKKVIGKGTRIAQSLMSTGISAFTDYKARHIGHQAAAVSFFAIFSIFPLLAFTAYFVGQLIGDEGHSQSTSMVLAILRDFVPTFQTWIEKGLFDVIQGSDLTSWVNALLLGWSGIGLFTALLGAMEALPEHFSHDHRAHTTRFVLAALTLGLFAAFVSTAVFCELAGKKSTQIPVILQNLPAEIQHIIYWMARSKLLLGAVSVSIVTLLYKLLPPVRLSWRAALTGSLIFTSLMLLSRSAYWIYLHYNHHAIQSSYGVFSTLILIMLWAHFCVSCLLYGCLFAMHMDRRADEKAGHASHSDLGSETTHTNGTGSHEEAA